MMYEKYRKLRDARGVNDFEVSKATDIASSTLYSWRDGEYTPKVDKISKLAEYFGVSLDYFYREDA